MVSSVFASLAKGKGMSLISETSYSNEMLGVIINRPMRDLLYKSILFYLHIKEIDLDFSLERHLRFQVSNSNKNVYILSKPETKLR